MSLNAGLYIDDGPPFLVWINADRNRLETYVRLAFAGRLAAPVRKIEVTRCELGLVHVWCDGRRVGYVIVSRSQCDAPGLIGR